MYLLNGSGPGQGPGLGLASLERYITGESGNFANRARAYASSTISCMDPGTGPLMFGWGNGMVPRPLG